MALKDDVELCKLKKQLLQINFVNVFGFNKRGVKWIILFEKI